MAHLIRIYTVFMPPQLQRICHCSTWQEHAIAQHSKNMPLFNMTRANPFSYSDQNRANIQRRWLISSGSTLFLCPPNFKAICHCFWVIRPSVRRSVYPSVRSSHFLMHSITLEPWMLLFWNGGAYCFWDVCACVRACVRPSVRLSVRASVRFAFWCIALLMNHAC